MNKTKSHLFTAPLQYFLFSGNYFRFIWHQSRGPVCTRFLRSARRVCDTLCSVSASNLLFLHQDWIQSSSVSDLTVRAYTQRKILTINVWMAFEATVMQGKTTINTWNQLFIFFLCSFVSNKLEVLLQKAGISTFYCNMNLNVYSSVLHSAFSLMAAG